MNTIFEDTRRAVLFQNGSKTYDLDLRNKGDLAFLLNEFFG